MILLSILIPTIKKRTFTLYKLVDHLKDQVGPQQSFYMQPGDTIDSKILHLFFREVDIIIYLDEGEIPTGKKRNKLYEMAQSKYCISLDDDDWVPDYYVCELLEAAKSDADCFGINGVMITDNVKTETWSISKDHPYKTVRTNLGNHYKRYPNHITGIKSEICKKFKFPDVSFGEDFDWATQIHNSGLIKTEYTIHKPLYEYRYNSQK